jgi:hypothetical protein
MTIRFENQSQWDNSVITSIEIKAPKEKVYKVVYQENPRPKLCPKIKNSTVVFDDGIVQEFYFDIAKDDGSMRRIRTISRCDGDIIEFFQPAPPQYLQGYFVKWIFEEVSMNCCKIIAENLWKMNEYTHTKFPADDKMSTEEKLRQHIILYSNSALEAIREKAVASI